MLGDKRAILILLLLVSSLMVTLPYAGIVKAESKTIIVPDDFITIQAAIDASYEGDVVFVRSGKYNESVSINHPISLIGEDPTTTTIVGDYHLNGTVILICHNNVSVIGFTIQPSAYSYSRKGIHLLHVRYCNVTGNIILENGNGIWLYGSSENTITENTINGPGDRSYGISLENSPNNLISNNLVTDNSYGISLEESDGNNLYNNTIINNDEAGLIIGSNGNILSDNIVNNQHIGITLFGANNILRGNKISNNDLNFELDWSTDWTISNFINDVDSSNTIDGKPIIYWVNKQEEKVPEDSPFVVLVNCANITVENLGLSKNVQGIIIVATTNSTIQKNSVQVLHAGILVYTSSNNKIANNLVFDGRVGIHLVSSFQNRVIGNSIKDTHTAIRLEKSNENIIERNIISEDNSGGIDLDASNNNHVFNNTISDCSWSALWFWNHASNNLFYLNNFINNHMHVELYVTDFQQFPENIWDNGTVGNFWSNYNGTDNNGDGIGDTPYIIDENNQDNHPLMELYTGPEYPTPPIEAPWVAGGFFPEPDSIDVPLDTSISISFGRPPGIVELSISPEVAINQTTIDNWGSYGALHTFYFSELLEPSTTYTVTMLYGTPNSTRTWKFTTVEESEMPPIEKNDPVDLTTTYLGIIVLALIFGIIVSLYLSKVIEKKQTGNIQTHEIFDWLKLMNMAIFHSFHHG